MRVLDKWELVGTLSVPYYHFMERGHAERAITPLSGVVAGDGVEPSLTVSETAVLPLDDPATKIKFLLFLF